MAWATFKLPVYSLERMLHLEEHDIRITDVRMGEEFGHPVLEVRLAGEGLPDGEVVPIMRRFESGLEILEGLEPLNPPRRAGG
jgi:hypothetical protein